MVSKRIVYIYVHSSDETMWEKGKSLGLEGEVLSMFSHGADEFKIGLEVDTKTGLCTAVSLDDRPIGAK